MLFWEHSRIIIKLEWGRFFPKIGKWHTLAIKEKKVTCSDSPLKVEIERKYSIDLIQVKEYKSAFFVSCDTGTDHSHS